MPYVVSMYAYIHGNIHACTRTVIHSHTHTKNTGVRVIHPSSDIYCLNEAPITPLPPPNELTSGTHTIFAYVSRKISSDPVTASIKLSFTVSAATPPPGAVHPPQFPVSESFWDVIDTLSHTYNTVQNTAQTGQNAGHNAHAGVVVGCAAESQVIEILTTLRNSGAAVHFCNTCAGISRQNGHAAGCDFGGKLNGLHQNDPEEQARYSEQSGAEDQGRRGEDHCSGQSAGRCPRAVDDHSSTGEQQGTCEGETSTEDCHTGRVDLDVDEWTGCVGDLNVNISYVIIHAWGTPVDEYGRLLVYWSNRVASGGVMIGSHYFSRGVCVCVWLCVCVCVCVCMRVVCVRVCVLLCVCVVCVCVCVMCVCVYVCV
jgi:hypothetical protein